MVEIRAVVQQLLQEGRLADLQAYLVSKVLSAKHREVLLRGYSVSDNALIVGASGQRAKLGQSCYDCAIEEI